MRPNAKNCLTALDSRSTITQEGGIKGNFATGFICYGG